jgi:hypothetical protein
VSRTGKRALSPIPYRKGDLEIQEHRRRLVWQYGELRTRQIMLGQDDASEDDLLAWRRLGRRRVAA